MKYIFSRIKIDLFEDKTLTYKVPQQPTSTTSLETLLFFCVYSTVSEIFIMFFFFVGKYCLETAGCIDLYSSIHNKRHCKYESANYAKRIKLKFYKLKPLSTMSSIIQYFLYIQCKLVNNLFDQITKANSLESTHRNI